LWFIARDKKNGRFRDRRGETLYIDARKLDKLIWANLEETGDGKE
jgi:type I restriction enzyme M protein